MTHSPVLRRSARSLGVLAVLAATAAMAGCASRAVVPPHAALASAAELAPGDGLADTRQPLSYRAPDTRWADYSQVMLTPVALYAGHDAGFHDASDDDKREVLAALQSSFAAALGRRYTLVARPGPRTLAVRVTLTGFEKNTPVLATLTKLLPLGLIRNTIKSANDEQGTLSGSLSYAVEVYDASTDRLLRAFVARRYPNAMNVAATLRTLDAARSAARDGGLALLDELR
ncbi:DUF3313 domain-containing protein [Rubrivivax sp. JA1029]|uniref:DUF3313 domain-containing protein n=1 Tax=Rubrivivax sp. JA1029 TaxID=2894193 RepID=UPI001E6397C3|nr:DUF3313 domain-containing protein [Rubrivivax sp. JA1029]MCC9646700.1 DUF3313 domain-containing protein [Rubrivivax sp. JA1029]